MKPTTQVKSWCEENGWSDPFWHDGCFWAFPPFPPGAVMPLPIPDRIRNYRTTAEILEYHFRLTEDSLERRTCVEGVAFLGFYLCLITLDLLMLWELALACGLILGFSWGDSFSPLRLIGELTLALFWDFILVSAQSQIRFFPFYNRLVYLKESLWLMWVRQSRPFRILSSLCHKGLAGEDWAFWLADLIWCYRFVLAVPQKRKKTQDKIQAVLNVMERQGQNCRGVRAYLARSIGV